VQVRPHAAPLQDRARSVQSAPEKQAWPDAAFGRTTRRQAVRFALVAMLHGRAAISARHAWPFAASNVAVPRDTERSELELLEPKLMPTLAKNGQINVAQSFCALDENAAHSTALAQYAAEKLARNAP
jgi:hypothetical protein